MKKSPSDKAKKKELDEYIQANLNSDYENIKRLCTNTGILAEQEELRETHPELYSADMNYIHEPFWSYNAEQLKEYGKRIIEKISPCFIDSQDVNDKHSAITQNGKQVKVREVKEFGRVLPLLYLQQLTQQTNPELAVPQIFIVPNNEKDIEFDFYMPSIQNNQSTLLLNLGFNALQVDSPSFTIYQEFVDGKQLHGDMSFRQYGHLDFNHKQVVRGANDNRKYLIDTKEAKNFFIAPLNPIPDSFYAYWNMNIGRDLPTTPDEFMKWQREQQAIMLKAKSLNFPLDMQKHRVNVGKLGDLSLTQNTTPQHQVMFDESKPYFDDPILDARRNLYIGRYDLFLKNSQDKPDLPLAEIFLPEVFNDYDSFVNLILAQFNNKHDKENEAALNKILAALIDNTDEFKENEVIRLINLIPNESDRTQDNAIGCELGNSLLSKMLAKHEVESTNVLKSAIKRQDRFGCQDTRILDSVLNFSSDQQIEKTLKEILSSDIETNENNRILHAKYLLNRLNKPTDVLVNKIIKYGNNSLIDTLLEKDYDAGNALYCVAQIIDEPSQAHLKARLTSSGDINWYLYEVADKILAKQPTDSEIDNAAAYLLSNGKVELLEKVLQQNPTHIPQTETTLKAILNGPYEGDLIFENAINARCKSIVDLFVKHGKPISNQQFNLVLNIKDHDISRSVIQSGNLKDPKTILLNAISSTDIYAVQLLAENPKNINSQVWFNAFQSKNDDIIKIITQALGEKPTVMYQSEVDQLFQDIETAKKLIESKIDLDKALFSAIKRIANPSAFQSGGFRGYSPSIDWHDMLNKIITNQPSADAIDKAMAYAINNSQIEIFDKLFNVKPEHTPKTDAMVQQIIGSNYHSKVVFENAITSNSMNVVKLMLEAGITPSQKQSSLARDDEMKTLLDSKTSQSKHSHAAKK